MGSLCPISIPITMQDISRCWNCIKEPASYTCRLEANLRALTAALEDLRAVRDDLKREVDLAELRGMKRLNQVQVWLLRSGTVISETEQLLRDSPQETEKLCLGGCFSKNYVSSYKFARRVASKLEEVADQVKAKGALEGVAEYELVASMDVRPMEATVGFKPTFDKVWSLLGQNEVGMIGLYGLGGVGKTTLLTQIYNKFLRTTPDDYDVIWVVVSKDHTIENVQAKLGEKLHLSSQESWKNKSSNEKAEDVYRILSRKKFVLFLDDVWERVDLIKVGVPLPSQENGAKVVFTTRLLYVCGEMEVNEQIEVRCLEKIEAWALFQQKVGEATLDSHPDIRELAKKVAAECRGLPLALIVIGRAMTGKRSPKSWEFAIEVLKNSAHKFEKTAKELYPVLKFSYDNLPSDTMRSCLLYCCLFSEDHSIPKSVLIDYWFCEGLLDAFESISKARLQGYDIIDSLLNASLLEQNGEDHVKMHDVIRDMALWISCECEAVKKRFFVQAGLQLREASEVGKWEGAGRVSLMQNQIESLMSTPTCPNLQTLFLNHNKVLERIENGFFQFMPNLVVLNLSECSELRELPKGISKLDSLKCLDLSFTNIQELPIEMKSLTKLKYLNLEDIIRPLRVPRQLISSFSNLQVFRCYLREFVATNKKVLERGVLISGEGEGLIEELGSLQQLNEIRIEMKGALAVEKFLRFDNLQECTEDLRLWNFSESQVFNVLDLANMKSLKCLSLRLCESVEEIERKSRASLQVSSRLPFNNTLCFHSLERVNLDTCGQLRDMSWLVLAPKLKNLRVVNCVKMNEIMNKQKLAGNASPDPFPKLETLILSDLPVLKSIYWKALPFLCLKEIRVFRCSNLKNLPLNSDSAKGNNLKIAGDEKWWGELEWEDEATRNAFSYSGRT